jgi:hypothetical protein
MRVCVCQALLDADDVQNARAPEHALRPWFSRGQDSIQIHNGRADRPFRARRPPPSSTLRCFVALLHRCLLSAEAIAW